MMQLLSMRRKPSTPRDRPVKASQSQSQPLVSELEPVRSVEAPPPQQLVSALEPATRRSDANDTCTPATTAPGFSAASSTTPGTTGAAMRDRPLEAAGSEATLSPSRPSGEHLSEARRSPPLASSDGGRRLGSPLPAERARGRLQAPSWEPRSGNALQAPRGRLDAEGQPGAAPSAPSLADRFDSLLTQARQPAADGLLASRPPLPTRASSPLEGRSPAVADLREPFLPLPRLPAHGHTGTASAVRASGAVSDGAGGTPSSASVRWPSSSGLTSPAGSPRGVSSLHLSAVPPPVFPSFLRGGGNAGSAGGATSGSTGGAGGEPSSCGDRPASPEKVDETRVVLARQIFTATFEGLRLGPEPAMRTHHSRSPATFAFFTVVDSLEYEKLSQLGDKEHLAGAEFQLCLEDAAPEIRERARALMLGAAVKITYQHHHVALGRERHYERVVMQLAVCEQPNLSSTLASSLAATGTPMTGLQATTSSLSPTTSSLLTPSAASKESPRSRMRQKVPEAAPPRTGLEQVGALRQKYGLPHGLPQSPRQASSNGSLGRAQEEPLLDVGGKARAQAVVPPLDVGGVGGTSSQNSGRPSFGSATSKPGTDDAAAATLRPGPAKPPNFAEQWGESPTLSRIQAFRREVLDSTRSKLNLTGSRSIGTDGLS